jgi:peptidyl-prolyl cis-trans isomerase C
MQKSLPSSVALILLALLASPALAADTKSDATVTVNGYSITRQVEAAFIEDQIARGASDTPAFRKAARDELIRRALLLGEASKKGLDKAGNTKGQMESAAQFVLIRAFLADYLKNHTVTDTEIQAVYETFVRHLGNQQYKPRHILLNTEDEAKAIIARLDAGENFADIAGKASQDPNSRDKGGDLGWNVPATFAAPVGEALLQLKKGQYTKTPVKSQSGYHVLYLEDIQELTPPTPEQIKPQLIERASQQKLEKMISELLETAKIK